MVFKRVHPPLSHQLIIQVLHLLESVRVLYGMILLLTISMVLSTMCASTTTPAPPPKLPGIITAGHLLPIGHLMNAQALTLIILHPRPIQEPANYIQERSIPVTPLATMTLPAHAVPEMPRKCGMTGQPEKGMLHLVLTELMIMLKLLIPLMAD